jgi:hypothetical protein
MERAVPSGFENGVSANSRTQSGTGLLTIRVIRSCRESLPHAIASTRTPRSARLGLTSVNVLQLHSQRAQVPTSRALIVSARISTERATSIS